MSVEHSSSTAMRRSSVSSSVNGAWVASPLMTSRVSRRNAKLAGILSCTDSGVACLLASRSGVLIAGDGGTDAHRTTSTGQTA